MEVLITQMLFINWVGSKYYKHTLNSPHWNYGFQFGINSGQGWGVFVNLVSIS